MSTDAQDDENRSLIEAFLSGQADELPASHRSGFVAVVGKPNVGKSSLVNALVGHKVAIISPKPQTTRRRLLGILTQPEAQVIFVDTPGIHQPRQAINRFMVNEAEAALKDSEVILFVTDVSQPPDEDDRRVAERIRDLPQPKLLAMNKADLLKPQQLSEHVEAHQALLQAELPPLTDQGRPVEQPAMLVSAMRGDNLDKLLALLLERLPYGPRYFPAGQHTDQSEQMLVAELIREQALYVLEDEVPHVLAVAIEEWQQRPNGVIFIAATLFVERDSQKMIVVGKGGERLKQIGMRARHEIERELNTRVYLELWVKVRPGWRKDEKLVERFLRAS